MQQTPAMFIAGDPALDFLNSVATPIDVPVDWLDDGDGLLSWLAQAQFVPVAVLRQVRSQASLGELNKVAEQARNLREWFRRFVQEHQGRPLRRHDLKIVYVTGYNVPGAEREALGPILRKPVDGALLLREVELALAAD